MTHCSRISGFRTLGLLLAAGFPDVLNGGNTMPSLSDFGLAPDDPRRHELRRKRYVIHDESGARPLPSDEYDPYLDEEVELPGVARSQAWLYFGIGAGLGVAVLAIAALLYFRGLIFGPALAPSPPAAPPSTAVQEARFAEWMDVHALGLARLAEARLTAPAVPPVTEVDSVVEEPLSAPHPRPPVLAPAEQGSGTNQLSNELDELERSLRPRGPAAPPRAPSDEQAPPEAPLPPPAEPTAPAETSSPAEPGPAPSPQ
jgi:hypothetical protein